MTDITTWVFINTAWLAVGLLIYYVLSLIKVFLLIRVQPMLYTGTEPDLKTATLWAMFKSRFFTDVQLHKSLFKYWVNAGGAGTWKLVGNKQINVLYNLIDTVTTTLLPFLIMAIIWAVLKFMIAHQIAYNALQITLSQIQVKLTYLNSFGVIQWLDDYKNWVYLGIFLFAAAFGSVRVWKKSINLTRKVVTTVLTVLTTLAGLTFFGGNLGNDVNTTVGELKELKLEVDSLHENVYRQTAKLLIYEDLKKAVERDVEENKNESRRIDSLQQAGERVNNGETYRRVFTPRMEVVKADFTANTTLYTNPKPRSNAAVEQGRPYSKYASGYYQQANTGTTTSTGQAYWKNSGNWNKENGMAYEKAVNEAMQQVRFADPELHAEMEVIAENITETLAEELVNAIAGPLGLQDLKIPAAIATFLVIEKCSDCFLPKVVQAAAGIKQGWAKVKGILATPCFTNTGANRQQLNAAIANHTTTYSLAIKDGLLAEANDRIDRMVSEQLNDICSGYEISEEKLVVLKQKVANEYKSSLNLANMSVSALNGIANMASIPVSILGGVLRSAPVFAVHPFPRAGCPLCAVGRL